MSPLPTVCASIAAPPPAITLPTRRRPGNLDPHGRGGCGARLWRRRHRVDGETARAVIRAGGHVTGIIPEFLVSKERMQEGVHELIVTRTMHERKMAMFERSTGFVALPGGIGTLEELAEILTWSQLKQHARPIILCNVAGFWDGLLGLIKHMTGEGFIRPGFEINLDVANGASDVVATYEAGRAKTHDVLGRKSCRTNSSVPHGTTTKNRSQGLSRSAQKTPASRSRAVHQTL